MPDRTRVGHWRRDRCDVYVGRGSIWGNPYVFPGKAARSRYPVTEVEDPLGAYEAHLRASPELMSRLPELRGRVLGCYCVRLDDPDEPERCHGQVPEHYVMRRWEVDPDGKLFALVEPTCVADSLEAARAYVPYGAVRVERHPTDEPQIVEVWL